MSKYVGGQSLLIASGVVLGAVGVRILLPLSEGRLAGIARRRPGVVIPIAAAIGLFTGLLANGGGFLLVPLFVMVLGLTMPESAHHHEQWHEQKPSAVGEESSKQSDRCGNRDHNSGAAPSDTRYTPLGEWKEDAHPDRAQDHT